MSTELDSPPPADSLLLELQRGISLAFQNAEQLYNEAELLGTHGSFARAYGLHQLSCEECSKAEILGVAALSYLRGHPINLDNLMKRLRTHKAKNLNNAYLLSSMTDEEREAAKSGDSKTARAIFRAQQAAFHNELDAKKNSSLYVDYKQGRFESPSERITEANVVEVQQLNATLLKNSSRMVTMIESAIADPTAVAAALRAVESFLTEARSTEGATAYSVSKALIEAVLTAAASAVDELDPQDP